MSAVLPLVLLSELLWLLQGTCACSSFLIGLTLPLLVPVVLACSFVWQLFGLALVYAGGLGNAAATDRDKGGKSS